MTDKKKVTMPPFQERWLAFKKTYGTWETYNFFKEELRPNGDTVGEKEIRKLPLIRDLEENPKSPASRLPAPRY